MRSGPVPRLGRGLWLASHDWGIGPGRLEAGWEPLFGHPNRVKNHPKKKNSNHVPDWVPHDLAPLT